MPIPVLVSGSTLLDALGFEFVFDGSASFSSWERGRLVRGWESFDLFPIAPGRLRLGGFEPGGTVLAGDDTLAILHFSVPAGGACLEYRTEAFVDDLAGVATCSGAARVIFPATASSGMVGVFEPMSDSCCYDTPDGTTLDVRAVLPPAGTFASVEFRIEVSPPAPGAVLAWQPSTEIASALGDPIDNSSALDDTSGVYLRFATCRSRAQGEIFLGTVHVIGLTGERDLLVKGSHRPVSTQLRCAHYGICAECSTVTCMPQVPPQADDPLVFRARINGRCPVGCVAVQPLTWSSLKRLFRD